MIYSTPRARASLIVAALLLASAGPANARRVIIPNENVSCGTWMAAKEGATDQDLINRNTLKSWVWGYLSRAGSAYAGELLGDVDGPALTGWMDNYCAAHPLNTIMDGAGALEKELAARLPPTARKQ